MSLTENKCRKALKRIRNDYLNGENKDCDILEQLINEHFDNPPFKTEWIPCSEKLPQPYEEVLVWFEYFRYGDYNCLYQTYGISQTINNNGNVEFSGFINGQSGWNSLRIIAWVPLLEPYEIVD